MSLLSINRKYTEMLGVVVAKGKQEIKVKVPCMEAVSRLGSRN